MEKTKFAVIGTGWRANFYFRIAKEAPDFFDVVAVVEPNKERAEAFSKNFAFPVVDNIDQAISKEPDFFVVSKSWGQMPGLIKQLNDLNQYVLAETWEMKSPEILADYYKSLTNPKLVQVAEQYIYQPYHTARLNVIKNGTIGEVTQVQMSAAHGYHGTSLIRHYLNAGFENCTIYAKGFKNQLTKARGRTEDPQSEVVAEDVQQFAILDFDGKWATFDFTNEQYTSQIRKNRVTVRGEKGEIDNITVRALIDYKTPTEYDLSQYVSGLYGDVGTLHTKQITAGDKLVYKNIFGSGRISDDELALAMSLYKMGEYTKGGEPCYPFEQCCQDQYLSIMIKKSQAEKREVTTETQVWANK